MATSLEELEARVRSLEAFRNIALGRIHAVSALILERWFQLLTHSPDPVIAAKEMRRQWLDAVQAAADTDAARANPLSQEVRIAFDELTGELLRRVEAAVGQTQKANPADSPT